MDAAARTVAHRMMLADSLGQPECFCGATLVQGLCPDGQCAHHGTAPKLKYCNCTSLLTQCGKCPNEACKMYGKVACSIALRDSTLDPQLQPNYRELNQQDDPGDHTHDPLRNADADSDADSVVGGTLVGTLHGAAVHREGAAVVPGPSRRVGDEVTRMCAEQPLDERSLKQFFIHFRRAVKAENDLEAAKALVRLGLLADGYSWGKAEKPNGTVQKYSTYWRNIMEQCGFSSPTEACALSKADVEAHISSWVEATHAKCAYNESHGRRQGGGQVVHKVEQNYFSGWGAVRAIFAKHGAWLSAVEALRAGGGEQGSGGHVLTLRVEGGLQVSVDVGKLPPATDPVPVPRTAAPEERAMAALASPPRLGDVQEAIQVAAAVASRGMTTAVRGGRRNKTTVAKAAPPCSGGKRKAAAAGSYSALDSLLGCAAIATAALSSSDSEDEDSRFWHAARKVPRQPRNA